MASEDVIELGSSDDDTEPAPKKKKPIPNAMVHIPSNLPGITITPAKPSTNKGPPPTKPKKTPSIDKTSPPVRTKPITIMANLKVNPLNRSKVSTTAVRVPIQNKILFKNNAKNIPSPNKAITINPISSIAQSLSKTQVVLKKVVPLKRPRTVMEMKQPNVLTGLPPSVTIKPVSTGVTFKPVKIAPGSAVTLLKTRRIVPKRKEQSEVLTVELDDDDTPESATASPQWYMRPEEQSKEEAAQKKPKEAKGKNKNESSMEVDSAEPSMEEKNNKEPDTTKYFEITIEDSPLKPIHRHPDIGKELPITIEDSPVKPITKATNNVESDSEMNEVIGDKHSKKKLNYPKQSKNCQQNNVVEIEIDFQDTTSVAETDTSPKNKLNETKESPKIKPNDSEKSPKNTSTESEKPGKQGENEKVNHSKISDVEQAKGVVIEDKEIVIEDKEIVIDDKEIVIEDDEFHPTYQKFINLCFKLENSEDMKKIVEKKIKSYYRQCPKDYVESEEFLDMVSSKIVSMEASPAKMYLYIKDIVDELNLQRKMQKSVVSDKVEMEKESPNTKYYEESLSRYDSKKQRQIRKLEKTIKKLHRAIQKLEEQEVDFDDDEDSVYLLTERYKERMVRVHAKFCQLTNTKMPSEPRIHIEARPGRPTGPAKKLEKWINRKVPIGTPLPFPDFHDVLRCVRAANEEDKLGWNDVDIMEEARDLFTRCGKKLQRRRQENEWRIAASRISAEVDPAENSLELKKKLDENKTVAAKKETELLNKYVDRQNLLKLEAVEIGDKEAEESPLESEEEEEIGENDNALDNKEKRKLRLKRLIKEKNKRGEDKENAKKIDSEEKNDKTEREDETSKGNVQNKVNEEISEEKSDNVESELLPSETEREVRKEDKQESDTVKDNNVEDKKENGNNAKENKQDENKDSESSDSDYKVECDIDELHLLQKLHSENEANSSTAESSDSDSPIPISDSLDSYSEIENGGKMCDVISIENSSYSESEMIIDGSSKDGSESFKKHKVEELVNANFEIEYSSTGIEESNKETAGEGTAEVVEENILLASSDDEEKDSADHVSIESTCINLRDDNISITETTVDGEAFEGENVFNDDNSLPENNNAIDTAKVSSGVENSHVSLATTQEIIKDSDHSSDKPTQQSSNGDTEMIDINDSPKEDVVEIRSASDANSVESTDIQADDTKIIIDSDHTSDKPTEQCSNVDTEMIDINDSPKEDVVDIRSASDANSVESTDIQADDTKIIKDSDHTSNKPTQQCSILDAEMIDNNDSPKEEVDIRSASDANSVENTDVQADDTNKDDINEAPESMDISEPVSREQSEVTQTVTV